MGVEEILQAFGKIVVAVDYIGHDADNSSTGIEARRIDEMDGEMRMRLRVEWKEAVPNSAVVRAGVPQGVKAMEPGFQHRCRETKHTGNSALAVGQLLV